MGTYFGQYHSPELPFTVDLQLKDLMDPFPVVV